MRGGHSPGDLTPFCSDLEAAWLAEHPDERHRRLEGTMVSADLSGFTAMSERLAVRGKVGAEELTASINECFTALIGAAAVDGGDVLKFGGDALLLWFEGPDHAARAVAAAARMQATLDAPRFRRAGLAMSVGAHSGAFDVYLVGRPDWRELVLVGEPVTRTVELEDAAGAGDVLVSPDTAALLPRAWLLGDPDPRARAAAVDLAAVDVGPTRPPPEREGVAGNLAARLVAPNLLADVMALRGVAGEHRLATVVFAAVMGTDESVARLGSRFADGVDDLVQHAQRFAERYRTSFLYSDVTADGMKLLVVAGAPVSSGDDEEAGLRFATDWVHGDPLGKLRAGVNRGRVFAGFLGSPDRQTYTVMGDPVNLAARLMSKARPGEVVAGDDVVERSGAVFTTEAIAPFLVKGKAEPVGAHIVGLPTGERRQAARARRLPLVGRTEELAQLRAAIGAAASGAGEVVEVVGDAGIGKTRLVQAVQEDPRFAVRIVTECQPYDAISPFAGVRPLLRRALGVEVAAAPGPAGAELARIAERVAPEVAPMLPLVALAVGADVPPTPEADAVAEEFRIARMHDALLQLLERALPRPTLLAVEDVAAVDDASLQLLRALAGRVPACPWLLLVTRRPDGPGLIEREAPGTLVKLQPLDAGATGELAHLAVQDRPLRGADLSAMVDRSGGNPLFVLELIDAAAGGLTGEDLPESIERLVASRVDRLPPSDRSLLRRAAVVGRVFHADVVDRLLEADGDRPVGDAAWRRLDELVEPDSSRVWRFRHALFRDVAYEGLPFARRRRMHGAVGELLEAGVAGDPDPALLSVHFWLAGDAERTWRYSVAAGEAAWRSLAVTEAIAAHSRALSVRRRLRDRSPAEVAAVAEALGDALERSARYEEARAAYEQARRTGAADGPGRARLMRKLGVLCERQGHYASALRWWTRAMRLVEGDRDPAGLSEQAALCLATGGVRHRQGRHGEMLAWAHRARARAAAAGDLWLEAYALDHAQVAASHGAGEPTTEPGEEALWRFAELGDVLHQGKVLNNLGVEAQFRGRWEEAAERYQHAADHFTRAGDIAEAATAANNLAEIRCDQGRLDEAVRLLESAHRDWLSSRFKVGVALSEANLGRALVRQGRFEEGMARLASSVDAFDAMGARAFVAEAQVRVAEAHVAAGRPTDALAVLSAVEGDGLPTTPPTAGRVEAWARAQLGDRAGALEAFDRAGAAAEPAGARFELAWCLHGTALLDADPARAAAARTRADQVLRDLGVVALPEVPLPL